ncbi:MAG: hypothetical protein AB3N28_11005 [Kordiimonas sp.]
MEKAGGVFFTALMGGVMFFALTKIYSHKEEQWAAAHPEHTAVVHVDTNKQTKPTKLPCRHS